MSASVQAVPSSLSRFGRDALFSTQEYPATYGYVGVGSLPQQSAFSTLNFPQDFTSQGRSQYPSSSIRRTGSSRSSEIPNRSPPMRDRTPIRHNRSSIPSRDRSASRSEILLAYATEQRHNQHERQQQIPVLPSQTMQNAAGVHRTTAYAPPTSEGYTSQSLYYASPPLPQQASSYSTGPNIYGPGSSQLSFFPIQSPDTHRNDGSASAFNPQDSLYVANAAATELPSLQCAEGGLNLFPPASAPLESSRDDLRRNIARPKPQCFEHGCNGREFSTFSNLLRHQRERSGNATKAICPHCGTEFTRTTARNGHLTSGKCKGRQDLGLGSEGEEGSP